MVGAIVIITARFLCLPFHSQQNDVRYARTRHSPDYRKAREENV